MAQLQYTYPDTVDDAYMLHEAHYKSSQGQNRSASFSNATTQKISIRKICYQFVSDSPGRKKTGK